MSWYDGAFWAVQAIYAKDADAAKVDRTGGGRNLVFSPTWNKELGWTSYAKSQIQTLLPAAGTTGYTAVWRGKLAAVTSNHICLAGQLGWNGSIVMHSWTGGKLYFGHNVSATGRVAIAVPMLTDITIIFKKTPANDQILYINGVLRSSAAGTSYPDNTCAVETNSGGMCAAVGIWHTTDIDVAALHTALMSITHDTYSKDLIDGFDGRLIT